MASATTTSCPLIRPISFNFLGRFCFVLSSIDFTDYKNTQAKLMQPSLTYFKSIISFQITRRWQRFKKFYASHIQVKGSGGSTFEKQSPNLQIFKWLSNVHCQWICCKVNRKWSSDIVKFAPITILLNADECGIQKQKSSRVEIERKHSRLLNAYFAS